MLLAASTFQSHLYSVLLPLRVQDIGIVFLQQNHINAFFCKSLLELTFWEKEEEENFVFLSDQKTDSDRNANVHCQMMDDEPLFKNEVCTQAHWGRSFFLCYASISSIYSWLTSSYAVRFTSFTFSWSNTCLTSGGHPSFQAVCCTTLLLSNSTTSRLSRQVPSVTSYLYDFTFFKCSIFFLHYWNKNLSHCPAWICLLVLAWVQFQCMHFCTLHLLLVMWHAERNLNFCQKIIPQKHVSFPRTCS